MIEENINSATTKFEGSISRSQQEELGKQLKSVSDDKFDVVMNVRIKNLKLTVLLSALFGLFGAGSFYLGLLKRGICKIIFNVFLPLTLGLIFLYWFSPLQKEYLIQTEDIYNAVLENEEYRYSFDNLKLVQEKYNSAYASFNDDITIVFAQAENLYSVKEFLSEEKDGININEVKCSAFINKLYYFTQHSSVSNLVTEIDNALLVLEELVDGEEEIEEYDEYYESKAGIERIYAAQEFLSNAVQFSDYATIIENLIPILNNLAKGETFDTVNCALNELQLSLNESYQSYSALLSYLEVITISEINKFKGQVNNLNNHIFNIQKEKEINTAESSADTDLGLAISEFGTIYDDFVNSEIDGNDSINTFITQLTNETAIATNSLKKINLAAFLDIDIDEKEKNIHHLITELKFQKDTFVEQNENYFAYLNNDFVNYVKNINKQLTEVKKYEVNNRLMLSETVSEIYLLIESIKADTNIDSIKSTIDNVSSEISDLQSRANEAYYNYRFNYLFVKIFFTVLLSIDLIVIFVYWIFEVFREREKCQNLNYNNVIQALK